MMKPGLNFTAITTPFYCHDGRGNFLLNKRSKKCRDEQGHWDCGGGRLRFGGEPSVGVLREVREEYGCAGTIDVQLPVFSSVRRVGRRKSHWIAIPFIIRVDRRKVKNNEPAKIDELGWHKLDKLPKPLHSGVRYVMAKYKKYFRNFSRT